ncbi:YaiI/YqxD family protein [Ruminiclostridium cellulolyticum]|uniref:UPF0178 protein Ccel_2994 n=1 Tax=Ruminiclostridium cellulolyticum (strain ATCC 35319 / DSM 5812 / JCM 6584 / H10) TaxID=394503 RepID=Y2994_RUMCH|nr:YaiI/YqxD family protein [Ruminiclostridium cellulolyticum]B8I8V6.1 RecName: Full=UPF0178 protein Ccel_2994 [Ruminiclostridium cellulolyticum H10]ACL77288.1 protein of unknown function DUF188 [Ruminiclostridium cellulolyticum H10]
MQILVDADACPVKDIITKNAKKYGIPVIMIIDTSHELNDGYSTVITVDKARDSVDIKLINMVQRGDIVVTQDYGVAAMGLGKGAKVLNQNGLIYSDANIDRLLFERHLGQKIRRAGGRTGTIRKRSKENDEAFEKALLLFIKPESEGPRDLKI